MYRQQYVSSSPRIGKNAVYFFFLCLLFDVRASVATITKLRTDNYKQLTNGKTVLLLFRDRNCVACKEVLRPIWAQLADEWANHPVGLVGDITCSHPRGKVLCDRFNVQDVPAILFGDPLDPQTYRGGYDQTSLSKLAQEHLHRTVCHVRHLEACDDATKKLVTELRAKSKDELIVEVAQIDHLLETAWANTFNMAEYNTNVTTTESETNYKWLLQLLAEYHDIPIKESLYMWYEDSDDSDDDDDVQGGEAHADADADDDEFWNEEDDDDEDYADGDDGFANDDFIGEEYTGDDDGGIGDEL